MNDEFERESDLDDLFLTDAEYLDLTEAEAEIGAVAYSGQDFDVEGLVRRMRNSDILVPQFGHDDSRIETAGFQRGFVWKKPQMDRFIESLLLGFPIPGVFFVRQRDRRYLVLDGQQRLRTLEYFYRGIYGGKEFTLQNVADRFLGLTYSTLADALRRTLDNAFIQATVVDTDGSPESLEAIYQIFERLNAGGTQLTPHEIRVALYAGDFVDLLETLNKNASWRSLYGSKSSRIRDQELILRILALYNNSSNYSRPLKGFLNDFVSRNRTASEPQIAASADLFVEAAQTLLEGPGQSALRAASRQVNAAKTEAIFVGLMRRLSGRTISPSEASRGVEILGQDQDFARSTVRATADEEQVSTRLRIATDAFAEN